MLNVKRGFVKLNPTYEVWLNVSQWIVNELTYEKMSRKNELHLDQLHASVIIIYILTLHVYLYLLYIQVSTFCQ